LITTEGLEITVNFDQGMNFKNAVKIGTPRLYTLYNNIFNFINPKWVINVRFEPSSHAIFSYFPSHAVFP